MRKIFYFLFVITLTFCVISCGKEGSASSPINEANLVGTYSLQSIIWTYAGSSYNIYDSLDDCEKDNLIRLNVDKTLDYIDAGMACVPPEDNTGDWQLRGDSIFFDGEGSKIKSFDGATLVLTGNGAGDPSISAVTTLKKQ